MWANYTDPDCGTWGAEMFSGLLQDNVYDATIISTYFDNDLGNETSTAFMENTGGVFVNQYPRFQLRNIDQGVRETNITDKRSEMFLEIESKALTVEPLVNAGLSVTLTADNEFVINTKTEFFKTVTNGNATYRIGAYIIEDNIISFQAPSDSLFVHRKVLRASAFPFAFGQPLATGPIALGTIFNHTFTIPLSSEWNVDNLEFAVIIWREGIPQQDDYIFENTNITGEYEDQSVSTSDINSSDFTMEIQPTISIDNTTLILNIDSWRKDIQISIINQAGQTVSTVVLDNTQIGQQTIQIGDGLDSGLYYAVARRGSQVSTKMFIRQ